MTKGCFQTALISLILLGLGEIGFVWFLATGLIDFAAVDG
jgi:hypothetical protein